ncbi:MAG TPA: transglycosylase domain-containing protein, partial [Pseudonocardiaceae bacterium]
MDQKAVGAGQGWWESGGLVILARFGISRRAPDFMINGISRLDNKVRAGRVLGLEITRRSRSVQQRIMEGVAVRGRLTDSADDGEADELVILSGELENEEEQPVRRAKRRRRFIDYPRRDRRGIRHWIPSWRLMLGTFVVFAGLLVGGFFIALHNVVIPQPNDFAVAQATIFEYSDGKTQIAHVGTNRVSVPLSQIPPDMQHALLAAEDRSFYTEPPISITGILRAAKKDVLSSGSNLEGGSTITQ